MNQLTASELTNLGGVRNGDEITFYLRNHIITAVLRQEQAAWWEVDGAHMPRQIISESEFKIFKYYLEQVDSADEAWESVKTHAQKFSNLMK